MTESIYDSCLLYKSQSLDIVDLQTDDILMLAEDLFVAKEEETIKATNITIKERTHFTLEILIKFNDILIELVSSEEITLRQKIRTDEISLMKNHDVSTISSRDVVRFKLSSKKQYVAQRARNAYIVFICQSEISFDFSYVAQSTKLFSNDIVVLNKRLQ